MSRSILSFLPQTQWPAGGLPAECPRCREAEKKSTKMAKPNTKASVAPDGTRMFRNLGRVSTCVVTPGGAYGFSISFIRRTSSPRDSLSTINCSLHVPQCILRMCWNSELLENNEFSIFYFHCDSGPGDVRFITWGFSRRGIRQNLLCNFAIHRPDPNRPVI